MTQPAPFLSSMMDLEPEWIDYNGHLNLAFYHVLFDRAGDEAALTLGLGPDYVRDRGHSHYATEAHICYLRELKLGDQVRSSFLLVDHDDKRLHIYQELIHAEGWIAATTELMYVHVDLSGPRVVPFPPDILTAVAAMRAAHAPLGRPARAGRSIGIKRP